MRTTYATAALFIALCSPASAGTTIQNQRDFQRVVGGASGMIQAAQWYDLCMGGAGGKNLDDRFLWLMTLLSSVAVDKEQAPAIMTAAHARMKPYLSTITCNMTEAEILKWADNGLNDIQAFAEGKPPGS